jgi:flagellar P-ring protein FlgI
VPAHAERVRDLGTFQGVRSNQLTGYGVVVGLAGTGDDNLEYLTQAMRGTSGRMGLQLAARRLARPQERGRGHHHRRPARLRQARPAHRRDRLDHRQGQVLRGGALIMTPLYGADGQIYAMAQGNLAVGGLGISAKDGSQLTVNVPTVGRIAEGASVERAVATGSIKLRTCCAGTCSMPISSPPRACATRSTPACPARPRSRTA